MSGRTDTERLEWLIKSLQQAEKNILEECNDFNLKGQLAEEKGAGDALDALRREFVFSIDETSRDLIDTAMDAEERG